MIPSIGTLRALYKEISVSQEAGKPLVVGGAQALAPLLRKELGAGSDGREDPRGAAVYVHIWAGDGFDEEALKWARRARTPIVALAPEGVDDVPYVLATDVVRLRGGSGFPVDALARAIARRLGEDGAPLAARLPVLRRAVAEELAATFARRNGIVAAALPGVDMPVLLRNQLRMVLRIAQCYGLDADPRERLPEIGATLAAGFGLRAVARELLDLVPVARWAVQGGVAYAGTRALGEATIIRLEAGRRAH